MKYCAFNKDGVITKVGFTTAPELIAQTEEYVLFNIDGDVADHTHYVDMTLMEPFRYTPAEQETKDNLLPGWRWKMPDRVVEYIWNAEQAKEGALELMTQQRAAAYPPLQDFADAMYWQSRGDPTKMEAYLAACDAVKQQFPKPEI